MTCCLASCLHNEADIRSKNIDRELKQQRQLLRQQVKILLLGSGESGKSTFLKQMVIIHGRGEFTSEETKQFRQLIYQNCVSSMRTLIQARQHFKLSWEYDDSAEYANYFVNVPSGNNFDVNTFLFLSHYLENLWKDSGIKQAYERRNEFQLTDSCKYFFDNLSRLSQVNYIPTNRDILFCRKATRSIAEHLFYIQNVPFLFVDVGGQRSQRQKWFECFDRMTCILYLFASNEYDQVISEDGKTNRVMESLSLFDTIVNNRCFANVALILFLNKTDLLSEKLAKSDFKKFFKEFSGDRLSVRDVHAFMVDLFDSVRRDRRRRFFFHSTTAVDTENIRRVFHDCKEVILEQNMKMLLLQ